MTQRRPIYLDHHATTPVDPAVVEAMRPTLDVEFGNPSSPGHVYGRRAREAVERAREEVARLVGSSPGDVVFTSGATESNNLLLRGLAAAAGGRRHVLISAGEHPSVREAADALAADGFEVETIPVDPMGRVSPEELDARLRNDTFLVSVIAASNEVGTVNPVTQLAAVAHRRGAWFHTDATQLVGHLPFDLQACGADAASLSAHKFHGPKGAGALVVRPGLRRHLRPLFFGGGQEGGLRPGTLNVTAVVGFGEAARVARARLDEDARRARALRDRLWDLLRKGLPNIHLNGHPQDRLPHNLHVSIPGMDGEALVLRLAESVALSTGSACAASKGHPSPVLAAMGLPPDRIQGSLRIGLGRFTTEDDVRQAAEAIVREALRLLELGGAGGTQAPSSLTGPSRSR